MKTRKMNFRKLILFVSVLGIASFFASCNEKSDVNPQMETPTLNTVVASELFTAEVFDETLEITDEAEELIDNTNLKSAELDGPNGNGKGHIHNGNHAGPCDSVRGTMENNHLSECVTVTRTINDDTKTIVIDFGEANCLCNDGRERRGKIIMVHEGNYWDSLAFVTITFEDFYVNDNQILGVKTVSQSINDEGYRVSAISVTGSVILADGAGTITHTAEKIRTIVQGMDTKMKRDDVTETTGYSSCILADGSESNMTIIEPLVRINEKECMKYIVKGIREIEKTGQSTITINYGDGTCDNLATITQDGVTTEFELKRKNDKIKGF